LLNIFLVSMQSVWLADGAYQLHQPPRRNLANFRSRSFCRLNNLSRRHGSV